MGLSKIDQDKWTGALKVIDYNNISFVDVNGDLSAPMYAEFTGLQAVEDLNGFSYLRRNRNGGSSLRAPGRSASKPPPRRV